MDDINKSGEKATLSFLNAAEIVGKRVEYTVLFFFLLIGDRA